MRMWTIQHRNVLDILRVKGMFKADGRRCMRWFKEDYRWMRSMLVKHRPGTVDRPLIWAWVSPKPDLRETGHLPTGTPGVRIELEIPEERVLCSDFVAWHYVLNDLYLPGDLDTLLAMQDAQDYPKEVIEASWERIFDLPLMKALLYSEDMSAPQRVQAVFTEFYDHEVVRVTEFTAR